MEHHFEAEAKVPLLHETHAKGSEKREVQPEEEVCIVNITKENQNQNQVMGKHTSTVPSAQLPDISQKPYKPKLISIGPCYTSEPGIENSVKEKFQKSFFGKNEELMDQCRQIFTASLKDWTRTWYDGNTGLHINDEQFDFVETSLLLDGCFILEFLYKMNSCDLKNVDEDVAQTITAFMKDDGKVARTLTDLLLFKNQFPFFILFKLHKSKSRYNDDAVPAEFDHLQNDKYNDDDALLKQFITLMKQYNVDDALLQLFIALVKKYNGDVLQKELNNLVMKNEDVASLKKVCVLVKECKYEALLKELMVLKEYDSGALLKKLMELMEDYALLQQLVVLVKKSFVDQVPKLTPQNVAAHEYKPKHLLQVVHSLCIPRTIAKCGGDNSVGLIEQINTATELEKDGVSFKKVGKVYVGHNDSNDDGTTLFHIDFSWGILKIPCFKIEDNTETFLRNMIDYEQHAHAHAPDAPKYFTDFAWFMGQLTRTQNDVNLLRRRGIIVNLLPTDEEVAIMFKQMSKGMVISTTFSGVYSKVSRFGEKAWYIWVGKLGQDFYYSPWKLISTIVGGLIVSLATAVSIKNLLK